MGFAEKWNALMQQGADPARIVIGHMNGSTDLSYHLRVLATGVSIGFDRFGLQVLAGCPYDMKRQAVLLGLLGMGYEKYHFVSRYGELLERSSVSDDRANGADALYMERQPSF